MDKLIYEGDFLFNADSGEIKEYIGMNNEVIIPEMIGGKAVTKIGERAFMDCKTLKSVTIPNCVTEIGKLAFGYCSNLINVTIPEGVTEIGEDVFRECTGLESVIIPDSVTAIGVFTLRT